MAENRIARELENRESAQRNKVWTPPQTLPAPNPQAGWVFRYIRTSTMGVADPQNTSAKFREGWEPVKAEDHPELMHHTDPNSSSWSSFMAAHRLSQFFSPLVASSTKEM